MYHLNEKYINNREKTISIWIGEEAMGGLIHAHTTILELPLYILLEIKSGYLLKTS